jgi:DeoR/GlpR family transcriptional regulator of sugar metabolism
VLAEEVDMRGIPGGDVLGVAVRDGVADDEQEHLGSGGRICRTCRGSSTHAKCANSAARRGLPGRVSIGGVIGGSRTVVAGSRQPIARSSPVIWVRSPGLKPGLLDKPILMTDAHHLMGFRHLAVTKWCDRHLARRRGDSTMSDRKMITLASRRQARLLQRLQSEAYLDTQALRTYLGVSEATVRRDLLDLEARGLIRRTHGGALPAVQVSQDYTNAERASRNTAEKARIGKVAAGLAKEGDVVFLDAGTTTLEVARRLLDQRQVTFITNGTDIAACLSGAGVERLFVTGGEYCDINHSLIGPIAIDAILRFNVDKLFLSVSSVDLQRSQIGISSPSMAATQRAMLQIAKDVIVVADHTKFSRTSLSVVAPLDEVDLVVTDRAFEDQVAPLPDALQRKFLFA